MQLWQGAKNIHELNLGHNVAGMKAESSLMGTLFLSIHFFFRSG